jgi:hypothetical protein
LRTGPLGRREAHISRFIEGFTSGFLRPAFIDSLGCERTFNRRARPARLRKSTRNSPSDPPSLNLKCALPINLREFLGEQFAGGLRIDEDGVFTLGPSAGEGALSRIARAIRRYSTERAHEQWAECAMPLARLGDDLDWAAESGEQAVLCLRCAVLATGADAIRRHREVGCVALELSARTAIHVEEPRGLPGMLLHVIGGFRLARAALGLPHYDLDCYVARGQVIFTWRPLPSA